MQTQTWLLMCWYLVSGPEYSADLVLSFAGIEGHDFWFPVGAQWNHKGPHVLVMNWFAGWPRHGCITLQGSRFTMAFGLSTTQHGPTIGSGSRPRRASVGVARRGKRVQGLVGEPAALA